mgnify:CR=1 FL=1
MSWKENAFPLGEGKVNLTSGTITDLPKVFLCVAAGNLTITWADGVKTSIVGLSIGDAVEVEGTATSVAITTGTYHIA